MLRTSTLGQFALIGLLAVSAAAGARQSANAPASPTPKLEPIEDVGVAPITVTPKASEKKITEKREQGRVTEVKVKTGGSSYTMKPNVPAGNAQPGDAQSSAIRAPQWTVLEFDLNAKKKKEKEEEAAASTPPPPPPPPAK